MKFKESHQKLCYNKLIVIHYARCTALEKFNFLIYDDKKEDSHTLKQLITEVGCNDISDVFIAETVSETKQFLNKDINAIFLDIELENNNNGIQFASYIKNQYPDIKIIFITAHIWYCEEVCPVKPDGFMVKPFNIEKVKRVYNHIRHLSTETSDDYIIAPISKNNSVRIFLNQISYIETCRRKLFFYDKENKLAFTVTEKLSDVETRLPDYFTRCHHSFCVNLNYVSDIQRYKVILRSGNTIPVSQKRYKKSRENFVEFLGRYI